MWIWQETGDDDVLSDGHSTSINGDEQDDTEGLSEEGVSSSGEENDGDIVMGTPVETIDIRRCVTNGGDVCIAQVAKALHVVASIQYRVEGNGGRWYARDETTNEFVPSDTGGCALIVSDILCKQLELEDRIKGHVNGETQDKVYKNFTDSKVLIRVLSLLKHHCRWEPPASAEAIPSESSRRQAFLSQHCSVCPRAKVHTEV